MEPGEAGREEEEGGEGMDNLEDGDGDDCGVSWGTECFKAVG